MQTTLSPNLVVYASMTNQSPENNLTPRIKVTLTQKGILDCRGKPLLQKLEQITLNDIEIDNLRQFFTVLDYFHLSWEREILKVVKKVVKNCKKL